jgi:cell wall-associated NlpC family hydrolase
MTKIDPRLNAFRPDLADLRLKGVVEAVQFTEGRRMQVDVPIVSLHKAPDSRSMQLTQALMGEFVNLLAVEGEWAWVQLIRDNYVGYVIASALTTEMMVPTHRVTVPSTFLYPDANIKSQPVVTVTMNAMVTVTIEDGKFSRLHDGRFIYAHHLKPVDEFESDFVAVADMFRHTPYYWGGKSVLGIDCSGLVQISLEACGMTALRDSDMQEETLGSRLMVNDLENLNRGDLIFWDGHVGIMRDAETLIHANGHHMMVVAEPLKLAVDRIAERYGQITSIKRL